MRVALFIEEDPAISSGTATTIEALLGHLPGDLDVIPYRLKANPLAGLCTGQLLDRARRDRIDVIHLTGCGPVAIVALLVAWRLNVPVVGSFPTDFASRPLRMCYLRALSHMCERVFVPALAARVCLAAETGLDPAKILAWRPAVDADTFTPAKRSAAIRERWQVSESRPAVIYAGAVSDEKGASRLLSLELALHRSHPMYRLIVVGEGPRRAEIEKRCIDALFVGEVPHGDMPVLLASADLFVCPSECCSTNHAVLEAQACGLPAVVMERGSARERVSEWSGVICRSTVDMIVETASLIRTEPRRTAMARAAREHARRQRWTSGLSSLYGGYRMAVALSSARRDLGPALVSQSRRL
ncbi:MAG TPA: glycosyltransferase [Vicinamibacterales bacterium]|nr:glycosyltransferase [Vicinamibacterales bacterium]